MTERRRFNGRERTALYLAADGRCTRCGGELPAGWHADHKQPWSRGGKTDVINGQALCPTCNEKKGAHVEPQPRAWQQRFIAKYHANTHPDFLLVACPGAGKTLASAFVIRDLIRDGVIDRVVVVVPSAALRGQWMLALAKLGIVVDSATMNNGQGEKNTIDGLPTQGWVVTYQSLYSDRGTHRILNSRRPTMAVLDEIHHLGDEAAWGKAALEALGPCVRRLGLSGTPFRPRDPIPFVEFDDEGKARYKDDNDGTPYPRGFDYSYGRALHDQPTPVRPILFDLYAGDVTWLEEWTGTEKTVNLAAKLSPKDRTKAKRHALDTRGNWLFRVLSDADERLSMVRGEGDPGAKGLIICNDTKHADRVRETLLGISGAGSVAVAVGKDAQGRDTSEQARETIAGFGDSSARWLIAVAMVSEGVDIPALRVGVWATVVRSELLFLQGLGRLVRRRGDLGEEVDQTAYMFVPKDEEMVRLADEVYEEAKTALLERDDEPGESTPREAAEFAQDMLPWDEFRRSQAEDPSIHAPGVGAVDPEMAARLARESGQSLGSVAAVLAAMTKLGMAQPQPGTMPAASAPSPTDGLSSYDKRLKRAQGELEALCKQVTMAWLRKNDHSYREFGETISKVKVEIYGKAGFRPGNEYKRADIPQLVDAIAVAKKWLAEL